MLKDIQSDIEAGNGYEANVKVDVVQNILQSRRKLSSLREAVLKVQANKDHDSVVMNESVGQFKQTLEGERANFLQFQENQAALANKVQHVRDVAIGVQPWTDAVSQVEVLSLDPSLTAEEQLSVMYALKYARQDDRNDTMKFLNRANDQANEELASIGNALVQLENQEQLLIPAANAAQRGDQ